MALKERLTTIGLDHLARLDHSRRFGMEYARSGGIVKYLAFRPGGLHKFELSEEEFDKTYRQKLLQNIGSVALDLMYMTHRAYLPDDGVYDIILEIYTMSTTSGTMDLTTLNGKQLTDHYNGLAKASGRGLVKEFKSKAEAIKRIEALHEESKKPSTEQVERASEKKAEAEKLTAKVIAKAAKKPKVAPAEKDPGSDAIKATAQTLSKSAPAKKTKTERFPTAAKKAAKKSATKPAGGGRGLGIGAFCMGLIKKGKSNEEVLEAVRKEFPDAATSASSVAWYRNKLKSEGEIS